MLLKIDPLALHTYRLISYIVLNEVLMVGMRGNRGTVPGGGRTATVIDGLW